MGFSRNFTAVEKNSKKTKTNLKSILVNQTNLLRKPTWNLARLVIKLIRNLFITAEIRNKRGPRNYHRTCTLREEIISKELKLRKRYSMINTFQIKFLIGIQL